jgi:hypothetical protein
MPVCSAEAGRAAQRRLLHAFTGLMALWVALATPAVSATNAEGETRSIQLGPLQLGMRIAEIRAALPTAAWQLVSKSEFSGREFKIAAEDALELGGKRFKVEVHDLPHQWGIGLSAHLPEPNPLACEKAGMAVLAALETGTGTLQGRPRDEGELVPFGRASTARFTAFEGRREAVPRQQVARADVHTLVLATQLQAQRQEVKATVTFDAKSAQRCRVNIMALGWQPKPPMQTWAYDERKVVQRMNIGDRHRLASGVPLPEGGALLSMQCQVSRQSGRVLLCNELGDRPFAAAVSNVAGRYAGAMAFDMSGVDRDEPQPMLVDIPIRVSPSDVRPLDFGSAPLIPLADIVFTEQPPAKEVKHAFPIKALRKAVGARAALLCQVQSDGSLICLRPVVRQTDGQSDLAPDFEHGVTRLVPQYRVAPQLKSGGPSAGQVFGLSLLFAVSE